MTQRFRRPEGGLVDRGAPLAFEFDGTRYEGFAGDTLASALLAGGVDVVGRSFKYHRPRGLFSAGPEEPNAIVQVGPRFGGIQHEAHIGGRTAMSHQDQTHAARLRRRVHGPPPGRRGRRVTRRTPLETEPSNDSRAAVPGVHIFTRGRCRVGSPPVGQHC